MCRVARRFILPQPRGTFGREQVFLIRMFDMQSRDAILGGNPYVITQQERQPKNNINLNRNDEERDV